MRANPYKQKILLKEIFTRKNFFSNLLTYFRVLLKAIWLFFPSILFLLLALFAFWMLTQGKDLMQLTLEQSEVFYTFIIGTVFWVYITWFTSRIIGKIVYSSLSRKPRLEERFWGRFLIQMPRFLSFSCLTVIILGFIKLRYDPENDYDLYFLGVMLLSPFYYFGIYNFWVNRAQPVDKITMIGKKKRYLNTYCIIISALLLIALIIIVFYQSYWFLVGLLMAFQIGLVMLLVFRRKYIYVKFPDKDPEQYEDDNLVDTVRKFAFDKEDKIYTWAFLIVLSIGLYFYLNTILSVRFSDYIGSLSFVLFAFGILLILGNGVAFLSVFFRINLHIFVFALAFIMGLIFEPHGTRLEKKENSNEFSDRQSLHEYFENWVSERKPELDNQNIKEYPVYFVLSDGGASRAGYWVASVLAKLNEETSGKFNKHLFCLSGASGGSVGNAAYFNLLRAKQTDTTINNDVNAVQDYLGNDFLTFTLARMLGPDVFRHLFPLKSVDNRAAALARVLEEGPDPNSLLYDSMATQFSAIITQKGKPYSLPILCINTTRMQDGFPTVISNIDISDYRFNHRLDFLDLLPADKDIKLSTAVVLGASFPYVSPAGRVDSAGIKPNYFVDGAYFDNSGSGVVSEMVNMILHDSIYLRYKQKLKINILHIINSPDEGIELKKVNPLTNDLAAPVTTLLGAYGTQTMVNDNRLLNTMKYEFPNDKLYTKINLYDEGPKLNYSMNWVISKKLLHGMNECLKINIELKKLIIKINSTE